MGRIVKAMAGGAAALLLAAGAVAAQEGPMGPPPMGPGPRGVDFVAIDTDGNGILTRAELQARAVARLSPVDTNGDGAIDRAELVAALPPAPGGLLEVFAPNPSERMADRILALMGATEAGKVTVVELADGRVNMLLAALDTDRDAAISQDEADAARDRIGDRDGRHRHGDGERGPKPGRGDGPRPGPMMPWGPDENPDQG